MQPFLPVEADTFMFICSPLEHIFMVVFGGNVLKFDHKTFSSFS